MNTKTLVGVLAAGIVVVALAHVETAGQSKWTAPRMPWGDRTWATTRNSGGWYAPGSE